MNILYLCDEYPQCQHGGIGTVTQNLARELVQKGHNVTVCGFYPYYRIALPFEDDFGVSVYRHFYGNWLLLKFSKHKQLGRVVNIENQLNIYIEIIIKIIKEKKIDVIEIPDFNEGFRYSGPRFVEFPDFGIPKVVKLHGTYSFVAQIADGINREESLFRKEKSHIQNATIVLAVSEFAKETAMGIFDYTKDIPVIYNGISVLDVASYKEDSSKKIVVFAGTLSKEKGVLSLVMAWEKVIKAVPSAKLCLYGKVGNQIIDSIKTVTNEKTRNSIELKGFVNTKKLKEIYSTASCAIFPSYVESFGMAPLESMEIGCPTIFTKRATGREIITNEVNGLLIDPDNPHEIADAITLMLEDREKAQIMGANGAKTVRDIFNISRIANKHVELYSGLIKNRK
jgi:glycosyltransferase involved in cell wall biosynthesis